MNITIGKYFEKDKNGYYFNENKKEWLLKGVRCPNDRTRNDKAAEQAALDPVPLGMVYFYINAFLRLIKEDNGYKDENIKLDSIKLDGTDHVIVDNGITIRDNNNWLLPHWDETKKIYDIYDPKYDVIKSYFALERVSDLLWFKFTDKGHLAVVASSCDINWKDDTSCGFLVNEIGEKLDSSFAFVFPLTPQMFRTKAETNILFRKYTVSDIELAVGNYLIDKGVPIIDYYSHMGYRLEN